MIDLTDFANLLQETSNNINMMESEANNIDKRVTTMYNDKYTDVYETFEKITMLTEQMRSSARCYSPIFSLPKTEYMAKLYLDSDKKPELGIYRKPASAPKYYLNDKDLNFQRWITLEEDYKDTMYTSNAYDYKSVERLKHEVIDTLIQNWEEIESELVSNWKIAITKVMEEATERAQNKLGNSCDSYKKNYNLLNKEGV